LAQHLGQVSILQAQAHGKTLAVADLLLKKTRGKWMLASCTPRLEALAPDLPLDSQVLALTAALRTETAKYLDTFATNLAVDLDGRWSRMEDSALVQLFHAVQREATGAQLSAALSPGTHIFIPKGPTSVRQFYGLMPYEDKVARILITGAQLRLYLEHAARFFTYSHMPELYNREMAPTDFDMVDGVTYALDISKPLGSRVRDLRYRNEPVKEDRTFTLALTTHRLNGGGGYMKAIGFKGKAEFVSPATLRNLILQYVFSHPNLTLSVPGTWRLIPALDRERVLAQQP
jgi:2',3'-cyclic-nucleotide 2'-phosphodiesterase/3'-nucleotidase